MSPSAHPFAWVSERAQPRLLVTLAVLLVASTTLLVVATPDLVTDAAPAGIISFELAGSEERARAILASWPPHAREQAMFCQGVDSLYLFLYPAFLSLACVRLAKRSRPRLAAVGLALSWAVLAAGVFDAVENFALVQMLFGGAREGWARLALAAAVPKFALTALAALYALTALVLLAPGRD